MQSEPIHILIVDDNDTDVMIMREALSDTTLNATLHIAANGEDGMKFLRRVGEHSQAPRPDLILLDLNMPRKNGHEVLSEIKNDPLLARTPVVILTTSRAQEDIAKAYANHANCYIQKPLDFVSFEKIVAKIVDFWFGCVTRPQKLNR